MSARPAPSRIGLALALALVRVPETTGQTSPADQVQTWMHADARVVRFGEAFALTVEREWPLGAEPPPFAEASLDPLVVERRGERRDQRGGRVREVLEFQARAFLLDGLDWPEYGLSLGVIPALDPAAPGPVELPGPLLEVPAATHGWAWYLGAGLLVLGAVLGFLRRHRHEAAAERIPGGSPWDAARRGLARLRSMDQHGDPDLRGRSEALIGCLRELLAAGFQVPAESRTTPEILQHPSVARECSRTARDLLAETLASCDHLRFARPPGRASDWVQAMTGLEGFVERTEPAARSDHPEDGLAGDRA